MSSKSNANAEHVAWKWRQRLGRGFDVSVRDEVQHISIDIVKQGKLLASATDRDGAWELVDAAGKTVRVGGEVPILLTEEMLEYLEEQGHQIARSL